LGGRKRPCEPSGRGIKGRKRPFGRGSRAKGGE
jgi:hypothetical protein